MHPDHLDANKKQITREGKRGTIAQWQSDRLFIERLIVLSTATDWTAIAILELEL